jgi:hypothetical protein
MTREFGIAMVLSDRRSSRKRPAEMIPCERCLDRSFYPTTELLD